MSELLCEKYSDCMVNLGSRTWGAIGRWYGGAGAIALVCIGVNERDGGALYNPTCARDLDAKIERLLEAAAR